MVGQYPFAAGIGKVIDHYGPWAASLMSSVLFSLGYGLFALEIVKAINTTQTSQITLYQLTLYFFLAGCGTAFS
jgi:hypothetical protein